MFNINLKNKFFSILNEDNDANLKNNLNLSGKEEIIKNKGLKLNLFNPEDIIGFMEDKNDLMDLIMKTHMLINEHFPEADLYLKLHEDPE